MVVQGLEAQDEAVMVRTAVLFPGPTAEGLQAARRFQQLQLGNVTAQKLFDSAIFGNVHVDQVTPPYLVSSSSRLVTLRPRG